MFWKGCGCGLRRHLNPPVDYIWISDDFLNSELRLFTRIQSHRRHASSTPGPLEARKRATKRRMMNIARLGGAEQIDPSLLSGMNKGPQDGSWQWQAPTRSASKPEKEHLPLPAWLTDADVPIRAQRQAQLDDTKLQIQNEKRIQHDPKFMEKFKACQNLESLRGLAAESNIDLRNYSRLAFHQLCDAENPIRNLLDILESPALDDPKAQNLGYFLDGQRPRSLTDEDAEELARVFEPWLLKQLSPGRRSDSEILLLSRFVIDVSSLIKDRKLTDKMQNMWWSALAKSKSMGFTRPDIRYTRIEKMMRSQQLPVLVPFLQQLSDQEKARFILKSWFCPSECKNPYREKWRTTVHCFDQICEERKTESPFLILLWMMEMRLLLSKEKTERIFELLELLRMPRLMAGIILGLARIGILIYKNPVVRAIRSNIRLAPSRAWYVFQRATRLPLEEFAELAETTILNPRIHPQATWRCRRHRKAYVSTAFGHDHKRINSARAQLLERMALAYSQARHLSPRMAFRMVCRCYAEYRHEHLGSPSLGMSIALTTAGIVRSLQAGQWVSSVKLRWILSIVRRVEGNAVADKVDNLTFQWGLQEITKSKERGLSAGHLRPGDGKMRFVFRHKWNRYRREFVKTMKPLEKPPFQATIPRTKLRTPSSFAANAQGEDDTCI